MSDDTPPERQANAAIEFLESIPDYTCLTTPACLAQCWMHFKRLALAYEEQQALLELYEKRSK